MDIRKICPTAVNGLLSRVSRTQPVPSIAAWFAGSARTAKMASAGALMTVVALTLSSATWLPPHELSLSPVLTFAKSGTHRWRRHRTDRRPPPSCSPRLPVRDGRDEPRAGDLSAARAMSAQQRCRVPPNAGSYPGVTCLHCADQGQLERPRRTSPEVTSGA